MTDDFDIDEFIAGYEPQVVPVKVCPKGSLVAEHAALDAALNAAAQEAGDVMRDPEVSRLKAEVAAIERRIEEESRTFYFRAVPRRRWQDLKRQHPPTEQQRREDRLDVNLETFVVPAIALASYKPKLELEQANRLAETLPDGEIQKLFAAVIEVQGEILVPKSVLAAAIDRVDPNARSSTTAALAAYLAAGSSADHDGASPGTSTTTPDD
ncbi:MAG TPA: hypothetical protein VKZ72_01920 [Acidimicrobiales bacterium]|jgi:hypothetical protein|nr:hypothetical protein [Acidimicrobiales bacterium]